MTVSTRIDGNVGILEFHRPPLNFFDQELLAEIGAALRAFDAETAVRVVVLCAEGRHFCPGADLRTMDEAGLRAVYRDAFALFTTRKPIVAALQGAVVGGGLGLALAADFRVGTPETRLTANFARLGFHQGFGLSVTLPAVVGNQVAAELLLSGRNVLGEEARDLGLLDRLAPAAELLDAAMDFARAMAESAPLSLTAIRATLRRRLVADVHAALDVEATAQAALLSTPDFAEGIRASIEKRAPQFTGTGPSEG
ncbi:enoyl-CoA hydratase/isomerase family protein [Microbacterium gorillae]|uniref:enoyl-CoA hydratase/isomerase family protein n=1 Tax=Microbacterium gorillae TaxID=1231063 RepID=UPI0005911773|nr:enoyl-CoA hydratase/isomerase family protein [Microbacterium gorillae]